MKTQTYSPVDHFDNSVDAPMTIAGRHGRPCVMRKVYIHPISGQKFVKKGEPLVSQWEGDNFNLGKSLKKLGKSKLGKFVKKAANPLTAIKASIQIAKDVTAFSVLKPFDKLMRNAIRKKGLTAPHKLSDVAKVFFDNVVKKHANGYDDIETENLEDHLVPLMIIPPIIAFVKDVISKGKKNKVKVAAGQKPDVLPDAIAAIAQDGIAVEKDLTSKVAAGGAVMDAEGRPTGGVAGPGVSHSMAIPKMVWYIGGAIVALIIGVMLFKK